MKNDKKYYQQRKKIEMNIEYLDIHETLKKALFEVNQKLYNLAMHHMIFNLTIFLENICQKDGDLLLDFILEMMNSYSDQWNEPTLFNEDIRDFDKFTEKDILVVHDFSLFQDEILDSGYRLRYFIPDMNKNKATLLLLCEDKLENFYNDLFHENSFSNKISFRIHGPSYTTEEIVENLLIRYSENNEKVGVKKEVLQKIVQEVLDKKLCFLSNCVHFLYDYSHKQRILLGKDLINEECFPSFPLKKKKTQLSDLVGLSNVKQEISSLKNYLSFQKKLEQKVENIYLNLLFLGNPGTGKTTVGKIYASILYELGYIKENKVIEIVPNDLIAKYVGHTRDQTRKILEKAKGGILFIDEAYLIADTNFSSGQASFMKEAVVELLKYMEDSTNVIIFAGYPKETLRLYDSNPGFQSRICKEIYFEDYTEEELLKILKKKLIPLGLKTDKEADAEIKWIFKTEKEKKNFGNARFCNTYLQMILMNHANQCLKEENYLISKEDVVFQKKQAYSIGFIGGD